jgi:hypothetical protein
MGETRRTLESLNVPQVTRRVGTPSRGRTRGKAGRDELYGLLVGFGCGVGIGVRPTGGGVAPGTDGPPDGLADGFGANPQMVQLKRP